MSSNQTHDDAEEFCAHLFDRQLAIAGFTSFTMSMMVQVSSTYGYVLGSNLVGIFVTNFYLMTQVMKARSKFDVLYPNLYATPGFHKHADEFNRVQRGHQHYFEYLTFFTLANVVGGIHFPWVSVACVICYNLGSVLFQVGYADAALDVKRARYRKGGPIKYLGLIGSLVTALVTCWSITIR
jgi:glutathione S-transferase